MNLVFRLTHSVHIPNFSSSVNFDHCRPWLMDVWMILFNIVWLKSFFKEVQIGSNYQNLFKDLTKWGVFSCKFPKTNRRVECKQVLIVNSFWRHLHYCQPCFLCSPCKNAYLVIHYWSICEQKLKHHMEASQIHKLFIILDFEIVVKMVWFVIKSFMLYL